MEPERVQRIPGGVARPGKFSQKGTLAALGLSIDPCGYAVDCQRSAACSG